LSESQLKNNFSSNSLQRSTVQLNKKYSGHFKTASKHRRRGGDFIVSKNYDEKLNK
jgi:hypothetical protein